LVALFCGKRVEHHAVFPGEIALNDNISGLLKRYGLTPRVVRLMAVQE